MLVLRDVSLHDAQLKRLLEEPLTRPLGSMLAPRCFVRFERDGHVDDETTLVQDWLERKRLVLADPMPAQTWSSTEVLCAEPEVSPLAAAIKAYEAERQGGTQPELPRARKLSSQLGQSRGSQHTQARSVRTRTRVQAPSPRSARPALSSPDAPPRSSALFAGIVDGWERLPNKAAGARPGPQTAARYQVWATAAVFAIFALVLAFALTLHLVPPAPLYPQPQAEISGKSASLFRR